MLRRMVMVGVCLIPAAAGCETCRLFYRNIPTFVEETQPEYRIMPPAADSVCLTVESIRRGPRGVTLYLKLRNLRKDAAMQLVSGKVGVRLGSGLRRQPMSFDDAVAMSREYGPLTYGEAFASALDNVHHLEWQVDVMRVRVIGPGQEEDFALVIGTPPDEPSLTLDFQQALHLLIGADRQPRELQPPLTAAVKLPRILPENFWPGWLRIGFQYG